MAETGTPLRAVHRPRVRREVRLPALGASTRAVRGVSRGDLLRGDRHPHAGEPNRQARLGRDRPVRPAMTALASARRLPCLEVPVVLPPVAHRVSVVLSARRSPLEKSSARQSLPAHGALPGAASSAIVPAPVRPFGAFSSLADSRSACALCAASWVCCARMARSCADVRGGFMRRALPATGTSITGPARQRAQRSRGNPA